MPHRLPRTIDKVGSAISSLAGLIGSLIFRNHKPRYELPTDLPVDDPRFEHAMASALNTPIVKGNHVSTLLNGQDIFPAMIDAIENAEHSITFETFIYWSGDIAKRFTDALVNRARDGVNVHVTIDAVGSDKIDKSYLAAMEDAGIQVVIYHRLKWTNFLNLRSGPSLSSRTHRKLMIVDGSVGFIGGVGIADPWTGDARNENQWRDNHYRVEGPIVAQLQSAFLDNWIDTTGLVLAGDTYFPPSKPAGDQRVQLFMSSPESGGARNMQLMFLLMIASARKSLWLTTPYFVLDEQSRQALIDARKRGVDVKVLLPRRTDYEVVRRASRRDWGMMLEAGIEIYEFLPTMIHTKSMIVDDHCVSIGSANLDNRSFKLNDEANINVFDQGFAAEHQRIFKADLERSERITLEAHEGRPMKAKAVDYAASLLNPQL